MPTSPQTATEPSLGGGGAGECWCEVVSREWLLGQLRGDSKGLVVLDCRGSNEYDESHIRSSVNFSIPSIMLRRLAAGKIDLVSTVKCRELRARIAETYRESVFVLYNDCGVPSASQQHQLHHHPAAAGDSTLAVLARRLAQDGCRVVCLEDGFSRFKAAYPEWCDSCSQLHDTGSILSVSAGGLPAASADPLPLMGLRSLRISAPPLHHRSHRSCDSLSSTANSSTDSSDTDDRCDSSLGLEEDKEFPVEILPYLFLGNAANSEDSQALARHSIQYVLNVTPDLPNVFEELGSIKYMQIPITDHWSQNLASHFPHAIEFIDEARSRNKGVLVHCLAGISRSVTITVAYLMYKCSLNLNDAFNLVRSRKSNIAPNFHFMEQLHSFEKELKLDVSSQSPDAILEQIRREQQLKGARLGDEPNLKAHAKVSAPCALCRAGGARGGPDCKCFCAGTMPQPASLVSRTTRIGDFLSPLGQIGVSPDSGIEFDRWASSATPGD